jgi:hypothetical protein
MNLPISRFPEAGCANFGRILDPGLCGALREKIDKARKVKSSIFYATKKEFEKHGRWVNYAPGRTSHNLLLKKGYDLSFIETNKRFVSAVEKLVGPDYQIMKKAVIRSVPHRVVPDWIMDLVQDVGRPNLNPFVHDQFQDVQYFLSTDFHQDKTRPESNFATVYVYLDDVAAEDSALHLLVGSHKLGMTHYPHMLRRSHADPRYWFYSDINGNHEKCEDVLVTGGAGMVSTFHNMTLHGTQLNNSDNPRISIRYLVVKNPDCRKDTLLDAANRNIHGPQRLLNSRLDVVVGQPFQRTGSSLLSYGEPLFDT